MEGGRREGGREEQEDGYPCVGSPVTGWPVVIVSASAFAAAVSRSGPGRGREGGEDWGTGGRGTRCPPHTPPSR